MNGRDTKSILLVTLALLTAAYSPLNIYGDKLQDARRWFARGREASGRVAAVSDVLTTMATAVAAKKSPTCPIA